MNTEGDILERWEAEKASYDAWGNFVARTVINGVVETVGDGHEVFLRLPVEPRLKGNASLIQKALHRGKRYSNPYDDIEDKVGVRFVVLTSDQIPTIEKIVTGDAAKFWFWEKARDFVAERDSRPWEFGYQSVHYVLRSKVGVSHDSMQIPPDLPCEVQIRTLLQHAYSEVTHDTIYKPSVKSTPEMMRAAAKAMALIEATDDYFRQVGGLIDAAVRDQKLLSTGLASYFEQRIGVPTLGTPLNGAIIDAYVHLLEGIDVETIHSWLDSKPFIAERVRRRSATQTLYSLPAILLVYYVVGNFPAFALTGDVLADDELRPIYSDLGLSMA
jgi:putative GTP pyrophosphokinase